jgi:D-alanyl-D-alanine dipeptidase
LAFVTLAVGVLLALTTTMCATPPRPRPPATVPYTPLPPDIPRPATPPPVSAAEDCARSGPYSQAAARNAASLDTVDWAPFGRAETGWRTYGPVVAAAAGTVCAPTSPGFAEAVARWERTRGRDADGVLSPDDFVALKNEAHGRRPFVQVRGRGVCPDAPPPTRLVTAGPTEGYRGKAVQMRPAVLAAYRRMVAAARKEDPRIAADPEMLTIFSAYRSPDYDAARCERDGNCQGITRAKCSPHRTGLALDLTVGAAPGFTVDSTADPNRLHMSQTPAYQWLVKNAGRFGFVNYVFEPWHWEYVEEPI